MAHFLIGGAAAQLEARDRDRALQQYQYERNMDRLLANDAYRREQDAYARQADEERWNYNRMNNDRQYRFDRDKFNWARQNADRSYALNKRNMDFNYERGVKQDAREEADRWALGLNRGEYQRALAAADGTAPPGTYTEFRRMNDLPEGPVNYAGLYSQDPQRRQQAVGEITRQIAGGIYNRMPTAEQAVNYQSAHPELRINPYQREAVRLRRVGEEQTALNYERQQQAAQQKHDWAMEAATGAARRQAQSAEAKAQEQRRYNQTVLEIQSELGKYELGEGVKPETAVKVIYDIAVQNNMSPAEAVRQVAKVYGWGANLLSRTSAAAQKNQGGGPPVGPGIPLNSKAGTADGGAGAREYKRAEEAVADNIRLIEGYQAQLKQMKERGEDSYDRPGAFHRNHTVKVKSRKYEQIENVLREIEKRNAQLLEQYPEIRNSIAGDTVWVSPETAGGLK